MLRQEAGVVGLFIAELARPLGPARLLGPPWALLGQRQAAGPISGPRIPVSEDWILKTLCNAQMSVHNHLGSRYLSSLFIFQLTVVAGKQ